MMKIYYKFFYFWSALRVEAEFFIEKTAITFIWARRAKLASPRLPAAGGK